MAMQQTHTSSCTSSCTSSYTCRSATAMRNHQQIKTQLQPANNLPHLGPREQVLLVHPDGVEYGVAQGAVLAGRPRVGLARGQQEVGRRPVAV